MTSNRGHTARPIDPDEWEPPRMCVCPVGMDHPFAGVIDIRILLEEGDADE